MFRLKYIFISVIVLIFNLLLFNDIYASESSPPDTTVDNPEKGYQRTIDNISGIEIHKKKKSDDIRFVVNSVLFIPRITTSIIMREIGKGANLATEEEVIDKVKEVLYFYEGSQYNFGWFPYANLVSGDKVGIGAGIFFKVKPLQGYSRYIWVNEDCWNYKLSLKHYYNRNNKSSFGIRSIVNFENDRVYYGIGKDPEADARSLMYSPIADTKGNYIQEYYSLQFYLQHNFNQANKITLSSTYFHRVQGTNDDLDDFSINFDYQNLLQDYYTLYNELAYWKWINNYDDDLCRSHLELYSGVANIVDGSSSDYLRAGFDLEYDQPVYLGNRILATRLVFNMVEELGDEGLAFADYPRSSAFRGVSSRHLLRIDRLSAVPSLEYRWPVSWKLHGFIFGDALVVGRTISDLEIDGSTPWATGIGMNLVHKRKSIGGFFFAYGSEGFRATLKIGSSLSSNDRSKWY